MTSTTFSEFEAHLAEVLPGYESRPQQQALAQQIEASIMGRTHLLGEAGCGVGKSLGYMIPAILSGKRVVIATATKALQDQIANKDAPFLAEHLNFTFALLKGRSNYACPAKARDAVDFPHLSAFLKEIEAEDFHGERDQFSFDMTDADWRKVAADTDDCQVYRCSKGTECFATRARKRASSADVVVVNHALYVTDLVVRDLTGGTVSMLGEHDILIVDEAHELSEYAASGLGAQFAEGTVKSMIGEVRNTVHRHWGDRDSEFSDVHARMEGALRVLWEALPKPEKGGSVARIRQSHIAEAQDAWFGMFAVLSDHVDLVNSLDLDAVDPRELDVAKRSHQRVQSRAISTARRFSDIVTRDFDDLVRWIEVSKKTYRGQVEERTTIKTAPINVGDYLRPMLFQADGGPTCILVSATMGGNGGQFIADQLGVDDFDWIDVGTPFDFQKQAVLYVPTHLPEPTPAKRQQWESMAISEMRTLVQASEGRALLLFTSNKDMKAAYEMLSGLLPYTCLMQGQEPNKALAEKFMEDTTSVLFATRSFFTGVDFQGEACSLVVISKLPFPVPSEPLNEARCEAIRARGGNDFADYSVPVMTLILQQGFGRLIRHRNDRGVVAILDPRMVTKGYGAKIRRALPDAPLVERPEDVVRFYDEVTAQVSAP
jgi:ATP-dependent DNA helicase DinG